MTRFPEHLPGPPLDPRWGGPGDPYLAAPPEEEDGGISWQRYRAAIRRFRWVVALAVLLGVGAAYGAWRFVRPSYVAQGSLWVNTVPAAIGQGPIAVQGLFQTRSWIDLLTSFTVLDSVVLSEKLYIRPSRPEDLDLFRDFRLEERFVPGSYVLALSGGGRGSLLRDNVLVETVEPGRPIGGSVGFAWTLPEGGAEAAREVPFTVVTPRDAALRLQETLDPQMNIEGNFLSISLRGTHPEQIAHVLNSVMDRHVHVAAELKRGELTERTNALARQLAEVESQLRDAERDLEEFRVSTITLPSDAAPIQAGLLATTAPAYDNYFLLREELEDVRTERAQVEELLEHVSVASFPLDRIETAPAAVTSLEMRDALARLSAARAERRDLLQRYTMDHPPVQELTARIVDLETNVIPNLIRQVLDRLDADERRLAARVGSAGAELEEIPPRSSEEARLTREVAQRAGMYADLLNRYETARLAEASTIPDIRILDRATPPEIPANDQRIRFALLALAAFVGLGVAAAILLDRLDPRIRYPDEIETRFGLPFLGVVPTIPRSNGRKSAQAAQGAFEAFRELRTNLTYAYGSAGPLVLAISSPGAGDGKSLLSANLAMAFAHQGRRTLLIDADSRRGHLHRSFGVERKPGLTDFLVHGGPVGDLVKGTKHQGLDIVTAGSRLSNSPELLASSAMSQAVGEFKGRYEVIIVDTPPLAAGSDALLLACLTGHLVIVVRSGSTGKDFARTKIEPIARLPIRVLGVVLNDYDAKGGGHYAYYGRYLPGYETGDEEAAPLRLPESTAISE